MELPLTPLEFARRTRRLYPEREAIPIHAHVIAMNSPDVEELRWFREHQRSIEPRSRCAGFNKDSAAKLFGVSWRNKSTLDVGLIRLAPYAVKQLTIKPDEKSFQNALDRLKP
jgi:hypothetical protein